MTRSFRVSAQWDEDAAVWVATSEDIMGLVSEAPSLDSLYARVTAIAPELLHENGVSADAASVIDFHVVGPFARDAAE